MPAQSIKSFSVPDCTATTAVSLQAGVTVTEGPNRIFLAYSCSPDTDVFISLASMTVVLKVRPADLLFCLVVSLRASLLSFLPGSPRPVLSPMQSPFLQPLPGPGVGGVRR